jgi:UDP-GlcNAc:undecaprenyl-phosphate/decaprenyl-phosphate GlcNAc-1-phosphate transferase
MNMITTAIAIILITFLTVCLAIKKIIYVSFKKHLFDEPVEERKIHLKNTPNLGGVAIFFSIFFTCSLFISTNSIANFNYVIAAAVILFTLGLTDDLVGVSPPKKLAAQLLAAVLATVLADIRFKSFYGVFGIQELTYWSSILFSVCFIVFLINAVNLIDGINALAGSVGLLCCTAFSFFFLKLNEPVLSYISIGMCGCLAGFLLYNITPAKIFMGDTGSLFLGFILSVFSIKFLEIFQAAPEMIKAQMPVSAPAILLAMLIIPVVDTLRIFFLRVKEKKSPFDADRNHIHHLLLDLRLSHMQATGILTGANLSVFVLVYLSGRTKTEYIMLLVFFYTSLLLGLLQYMKIRLAATQQKNAAPAYPRVTELVPLNLMAVNENMTTVDMMEASVLVEESSH